MRKEIAVKVVATRGVSIFLDCLTFQVSECCYRYERMLSDKNSEITEWLDRKIFETIEEVQSQATEWLWTYTNDRPSMAIGGITPAMKLKMAA